MICGISVTNESLQNCTFRFGLTQYIKRILTTTSKTVYIYVLLYVCFGNISTNCSPFLLGNSIKNSVWVRSIYFGWLCKTEWSITYEVTFLKNDRSGMVVSLNIFFFLASMPTFPWRIGGSSSRLSRRTSRSSITSIILLGEGPSNSNQDPL